MKYLFNSYPHQLLKMLCKQVTRQHKRYRLDPVLPCTAEKCFKVTLGNKLFHKSEHNQLYV